jgi:hypothetical protein
MSNANNATSGSSFLPPLSEIQNLTEIEDIELLLKDTIAREAALAIELDEAMKQTEKVESNLEIMEILP